MSTAKGRLARLIEEQKKAVESHGDTRWMNCTEGMEIEDRQVEIDSLKSALARQPCSICRSRHGSEVRHASE